MVEEKNKDISIEHVDADRAGIDDQHWARHLAATALMVKEGSDVYYFPYSRSTATVFVPTKDKGVEDSRRFVEYIKTHDIEQPVSNIRVISIDDERENRIKESNYL